MSQKTKKTKNITCFIKKNLDDAAISWKKKWFCFLNFFFFFIALEKIIFLNMQLDNAIPNLVKLVKDFLVQILKKKLPFPNKVTGASFSKIQNWHVFSYLRVQIVFW